MTIPQGFNAKLYDSVPATYQTLFESDSFTSPEKHKEAEAEARDLIVQALTTRYKIPCHSVANMRSVGYMRRNNIRLEDVAEGKIKLV